MSRFTIGIVGWETNPHSHCFEDFARGLADSLRTLGHEVIPSGEPNPGRYIIFGGNNLIDECNLIPPDAIIFNTEQVSAVKNPAAMMQNHHQYRKHVVWDYSEANIRALNALGIERTVLCPLGYCPAMTKIAPAVEEDVDVLFYGSTNASRLEILDALESEPSLRVVKLFNAYGAERDAWVARSKIILNLHFYYPPVFEIFRVSHLLANRKCVVSENGSHDQALEDFAGRATVLVGRDKIVDACKAYSADVELRQQMAERGFAEFKKLDLVEHVRRAVEESR